MTELALSSTAGARASCGGSGTLSLNWVQGFKKKKSGTGCVWKGRRWGQGVREGGVGQKTADKVIHNTQARQTEFLYTCRERSVNVAVVKGNFA